MKQKKVLIIGGGGFIGSNLSKLILEQRDYKVDIIDNFSRSNLEDHFILSNFKKEKKLKIYDADLTKKESFDILDKDYDYVFMMAALVGVDKVNSIPHEVIRINTLLTINTVEWLKSIKCSRVLFTSTSENYAGSVEFFNYKIPTDEEVPLTIEDISHPRFSYAVTKILGESSFLNYAKAGYFEAVIVRYHNVYGPNMGFRHVIPQLVERFNAKERPFKIYGHNQTRSFNFIEDAVIGTLLAIEKGKNQNIYHIGDSEEISIEELTKYIGAILKYNGDYEYAPTFPGSVSRRCPNISKAKKDISYNPKINWKIGVKDTVNWYTNYLSSNKPKESFYDKYSIKDSKKTK